MQDQNCEQFYEQDTKCLYRYSIHRLLKKHFESFLRNQKHTLIKIICTEDKQKHVIKILALFLLLSVNITFLLMA